MDLNNVSSPLLYMKLRLMKNFVKTLDKNGLAFQLNFVFPISLKCQTRRRNLRWSQMRNILKDENLDDHLSSFEINAWYYFEAVLKHNLITNKTGIIKKLITTK